MSLQERERLAYHEGAHAAAGLVYGRPVARVWIGDDGGGAAVASMRTTDINEVLTDIAISLVADVVGGTEASAVNYLVLDTHANDEADAIGFARNVVEATEVAALVEVGRERARALSTHDDFLQLRETIAQALLQRGRLDADQLDQINRERNR